MIASITVRRPHNLFPLIPQGLGITSGLHRQRRGFACIHFKQYCYSVSCVFTFTVNHTAVVLPQLSVMMQL